MRTISKKKLAVTGALTVVLAGTGTAAYAYWTSQGTGSGTATTRADANTLSVTQNGTPADMYPGDTAQPLKATVSNAAGAASAKVTSLVATVTTNKTGCTGADYLINGAAAGSPVSLNWTTVELAAGASQQSVNTIQFNNTASDQNACKNAIVSIAYVAQ